MHPGPRHVRSSTAALLVSEPVGNPALMAGYRVLRRLGSSDRADVYVGAAPERTVRMSEAGGAHREPHDRAESVVLKVFRPSAEEAIEREVRALTALSAGRVAALVDVGTLVDGRTVLVLEHLTGGSLSRYLDGRRVLLPGEAVTILAPITAALAELHENGLVHTDLNLSTVHFDTRGRPVLTGLGRLRDLPGTGLPRTEQVGAVRRKLAQVVRAVLDQVQPGATADNALRALHRWCALAADGDPAGTLDELEHLLFAWAEAVPVRLDRDRDDGSRTPISGQLLRRLLPESPAGTASASARRGRAGHPALVRMLGTLVTMAPATAGRLRDSVTGLRLVIGSRLPIRRAPVILGVVVAVVSTGLLLTVFGMRGDTDAQESRPAVSSSPAQGSGHDSGAESAVPDDPAAALVSGDDPVLAVPVLLERRGRCLDEVSVICLDGVHQTQSAALAADSYTLRMIQQGGGAPDRERLEEWSAALVERTGDAALVSVQAPDRERQPASVLVVKGEAGWRIREIFDY